MRLSRGDLLCLYFACQFNPLIFYLIVDSQGYDITGVRYIISVVVSMLFFSMALIKGYKITLAEYLHISVVLVLISGRAFLDLITGVELDFAVYIIFVEYVFVFLVVAMLYCTELSEYFSRYKKIIIFFMFTNTVIWAFSLINGISWGVFMAYISGITINRVPDFINIIFIPWVFATSGWLSAFFVTCYAIITSYRTLYLAVLVSLAFLLFFGTRSVRATILRNSLLSVMLIILAISIYADGLVLIERVFSLFTIESKVAGEASKSQRVVDFFTLLNTLPNCVFLGCGSVEPQSGISYYNFPYYPIWVLLIFGPLVMLLSLWIFLPLLLRRANIEHNFLLSIWAVLLIILLVFPYVHYFCLMFFISILQVPIVRGRF